MAKRTKEQYAADARRGWELRKRLGDPVHTPEMIAWARLQALYARLDPGAARLYCCDLAEAALPRYLAVRPGDPRPACVLFVARRFARGQAGEYERLATRRLAVATARDYAGLDGWPDDDDAMGDPHDPAYAAINAVGFCVDKPISTMLRAVLDWAQMAANEPALEFRLRQIAALEALLASTSAGRAG